MRRPVRAAALVAAATIVVTVAVPGGAAPVVDAVLAAHTGDTVRIVGVADFGASAQLSWPDPAGDPLFVTDPADPVAQLGADLVGARMRWPNAGNPDPEQWYLELRFDLAELGGPASGVPESVVYLWEFAVDGGESLAVWAMRSSQYQAPGSLEPAFRLLACEGGHDFAGPCTTRAVLDGAFEADSDPPSVRVHVPFALVGAAEGSRVERGELFPGHGGGLNVSTHVAVGGGATWVFDPVDAMQQREAFVVPTRTAAVALGASSQVPPGPGSWTPATIADDGATFEGWVDTSGSAPGSYVAWVQACLGDGNCSYAARAVASE